MLNEILTTIASLALNLFVITSMLAMGMSLTVKQIIDPLRNVRLVVLVLVGNFVLVPALALLLTAVLGFTQLDTVGKAILLTATMLYLFGVQLPTGVINVPLNNQLQTLDVSKMTQSAQAAARLNFEPRWNWWNRMRTAVATLVTTLLILLLFLL